MDQAAHRAYLDNLIKQSQAELEWMRSASEELEGAYTKITMAIDRASQDIPNWSPGELWYERELLDARQSLARSDTERAAQLHQDMIGLASAEPTSRWARWRQRRQLSPTVAQFHERASFVHHAYDTSRHDAYRWFR